MRRVVVLPAPFGPRKPVIRPGSTSKSRWSTAVKEPKRLVRPRTSMRPGGQRRVVRAPSCSPSPADAAGRRRDGPTQPQRNGPAEADPTRSVRARVRPYSGAPMTVLRDQLPWIGCCDDRVAAASSAPCCSRRAPRSSSRPSSRSWRSTDPRSSGPSTRATPAPGSCSSRSRSSRPSCRRPRSASRSRRSSSATSRSRPSGRSSRVRWPRSGSRRGGGGACRAPWRCCSRRSSR